MNGGIIDRWCLRRPLDLVHIEALLVKGDSSKIASAVPVVEEYLHYTIQILQTPSRNPEFPNAELCLPLFFLSGQLKEDYEARCKGGEELIADDVVFTNYKSEQRRLTL